MGRSIIDRDFFLYTLPSGEKKTLDDMTNEEFRSLSTIIRENYLLDLSSLDFEKDPNSPIILRIIHLNLRLLLKRLEQVEIVHDIFFSHSEPVKPQKKVLETIRSLRRCIPFKLANSNHIVRAELESLIQKDIVTLNQMLTVADNLFCESWSWLFSMNQIERDITATLYQQADELFIDDEHPCIKAIPTKCLEGLVDVLSSLYRKNEVWKTLNPESSFLHSGHIEIDESSLKDADAWKDIELRVVHKSEAASSDFLEQYKFKFSKVLQLKHDFSQVVLPEKTVTHIKALVEDYKERNQRNESSRLTFLFHGVPGTGKSMTSEAIAKELGMDLLRVQVGEVKRENMPSIIMFAIVRATTRKQILLLEECEDLLWQSNGMSSAWLKLVFEEFKGVAIFTTNYSVGQDFMRRITYPVFFKQPTLENRLKVFKNEISKVKNRSISIGDNNLKILLAKYPVSGGYFQQVLQLAGSISSSEIISENSLTEALEAISGGNSPNDDGFVEPRALGSQVQLDTEIKSTIARMAELAQKKSKGEALPFGGGISAIFYGPSGTGKTMVAEAIAHRIGLKFKRATPSDFLSPWVGETEQNIKKLFNAAKEEKALLFIDEAEGLLLNREDTVRSYERNQANEFLRRIEEFDGVLIAATNHREAIDVAFARRFLFHVKFQTPSAGIRLGIWKNWKHIVQLQDDELMNVAEQYELTGGEIQNIAKKSFSLGSININTVQMLCENQLAERIGASSRRIGI